jgi:hypothetical protein
MVLVIIIIMLLIMILNKNALVIIQECREHDGHAEFLFGMCSNFIYCRYEILNCSVFSKYGTFTLKVKISWNGVNVRDLRIMYNNRIYLSFSK